LLHPLSILKMGAAGFSRAVGHIFQNKDVKFPKDKLQHVLFLCKIRTMYIVLYMSGNIWILLLNQTCLLLDVTVSKL